MKAALTSEMMNDIKNAKSMQDFSFKYSPAYDITARTNEPKVHRIMVKGERTNNKWVWLGNNTGVYDFDSPAQARLFIKGLKSEMNLRSEESRQ